MRGQKEGDVQGGKVMSASREQPPSCKIIKASIVARSVFATCSFKFINDIITTTINYYTLQPNVMFKQCPLVAAPTQIGD